MTDTTPAKATNLIAMYKAAIGEKNQAYYLEKFTRFDGNGGGFKPSWNWGAFVGTFVWALYRKMYGLVFACLALIIVFAVGKQVSMFKEYVVFMELALALCFPIFGNALYYRKIKAKVKKAIDSTTDEQYAIQRLNRSSGVHIWVLYSALLFCVVIVAHILWRVYASKNDVSKVDEQPSAVTTQIKKETINQNTGLFANFEIVDTPSAVELSQTKKEIVDTPKVEPLSADLRPIISAYPRLLRLDMAAGLFDGGHYLHNVDATIGNYEQRLSRTPNDINAWGG